MLLGVVRAGGSSLVPALLRWESVNWDEMEWVGYLRFIVGPVWTLTNWTKFPKSARFFG